MPEPKHRLVNVNGVSVARRRAGRGSARHARARVPGALVLLAIAAAGDRRGWLSRRRFRPARLRPLLEVLEIRTRTVSIGSSRTCRALVHALRERDAILIGHDWGAPVVWTAAWLHPEDFSRRARHERAFLRTRPDRAARQSVRRALAARDASPRRRGRTGFLPGLLQHARTRSSRRSKSDLRGWVRDLMWTVSGERCARQRPRARRAWIPIELIRGERVVPATRPADARPLHDAGAHAATG